MGNVYSRKSIDDAIDVVIKKLSSIVNNVGLNTLSEDKGLISYITQVQSLMTCCYRNDVEMIVHKLFIEHALKTEAMGPGGFIEFIRSITDVPMHCLKESYYRADGEHGVSRVVTVSVAKDDDVAWLSERFMNDRLAKKIAIDALRLAGTAGRIIIEKTTCCKPSVELTSGFTFIHRPTWHLDITLKNARIVCIDGLIESVSEVHHLLEEAHASNEIVVLFVRGISNDVNSTLRHNYDRGKLKVIPVIVEFDLAGINTLNDISVVSDARLVTYLLGDLISNVRLSDAPYATIKLHGKQVVVIPRYVGKNLNAHLHELQRKRNEEKIDDIVELLNLRIKSLSNNHVIVRLTDDATYVAKSQEIDYFLRAYRSLVEHGTVNVGDTKRLTATYVAVESQMRNCVRILTGLEAIVCSS